MPMAFAGMRVLALESRHTLEIAGMIRDCGGAPFVVPAAEETPPGENRQAIEFARRLFRGGFDMVVFPTGVGARAFHKTLAQRSPAEKLAAALKSVTVVAQGPRAVVALREANTLVTVFVPPPHTWREVLAATRRRPERRIAVQEYGPSNTELLAGWRSRGAEVTPVRISQWRLPEERELLFEAARRAADGRIDVALFNASIQVPHLVRAAAEIGIEAPVLDGLRRMVVAAIGPNTAEALEEYGVRASLVASAPKIETLIAEAGAKAEELRLEKARAAADAPAVEKASAE